MGSDYKFMFIFLSEISEAYMCKSLEFYFISVKFCIIRSFSAI